MPRIPLYAEGRGTIVDLATGRLGTQAPSAAFEAVGQAQVRAGDELRRAGTEYAKNAMQFQNARQKLEFDFQVQRKKETTNRLADEYATRIMNESTTYSLNTTESDMELAAQGLIGSVQNPIINEIKTRTDIDEAQRTKLIGAVQKNMAPQVANIKKSAFGREQVNGGLAKDGMIDGFFNIAGQVATIEELNAYIAEGEAKYDEARRLGQPITGNKGSFRQEMRRRFYTSGITNADSFAALDAQEKALAADVGLNAGTRATLENSILGRRREITQNVEDAVLDELRVLNPTAEEITDIATQLRTRDVQSIIVERDNETITIPFAGADANFVSALADKFDAFVENEERELLDTVLTTAKSMVQDKSLAELQNMKQDMTKQENGQFTLFSSIDTFAGREALESVIDTEIRERKPRVLNEAQVLESDLFAKIRSQDGVMLPEDLTTQSQIDALYTSADALTERASYRMALGATVQASTIFKEIEFASPEDQAKALAAALADATDAKGAKAYEILTKRLTESRKERDADFVGYYMRRNKITDVSQVSPAEMIALQRKMGVPEADIRITDNNTITAFRNAYDQAETYDQKAKELDGFFARFGENSNRVLRHMVNTKQITLAENVIAKLGGDNIYSRAIYLGSQEEFINKAKQTVANGGLGSDVQVELRQEVNAVMESYLSSVMGAVTVDGVIGGGVTDKRASHGIEMSELVYNTASFLRMSDKNISAEDAVAVAYEAVIGNQYRFDTVNDSQVRFDASYDVIYSDMTEMLSYSISQSPEYLRSVVAAPPQLDGEPDFEYENRVDEYFSDLAQRGTWRTTVDNQGVFMVDQLGNLVQLKDQEDVEGAFGGFVFTTMDTLSDVATKFQEFKALDMDAKRRRLVAMGFDSNKTFALVDSSANRAWQELTFAEGPLF